MKLPKNCDCEISAMRMPKRLTDEDILSMKRVKPIDAARYLGVDVSTIYYGLQDGTFTFGTAMQSPKSENWIYDIRPKALVEYNKHGRVDMVKLLKDFKKLIETRADYE